LSKVALRANSRAENNKTVLKRAHPNKTLVGKSWKSRLNGRVQIENDLRGVR